MTEKDLDIAIEKCERIMEMDTRTLKNPESENGWLFDKVYELLQFLRQFQFEGGEDDTISRAAAITEFSNCELTPDGGIDVNYAIDFLKQMPPVDAVPVVRCQDCKWYQPDADKWCGYFECMGFEPDDYCSQGERKDGKGNENH